MNSELKNYLNEGDEIVYSFLYACDEMANTKFVTAERKITELLTLIASSTVLHKIVANASRGFDFRQGFAGARVKTGQVTSLLMPSGRDEQIAFAVNLLYAFDSGLVGFREFLEEFYFAESGIPFAFASFVRNVIVPLRRNVESAFIELKSGKQKFIDDIKLSDEQIGDVFNVLAELRHYVTLEPAITPLEQGELLTYIDGIGNSITGGRYTPVRSMFTALRNVSTTLYLSRSYFDREAAVDAVMSEIGI